MINLSKYDPEAVAQPTLGGYGDADYRTPVYIRTQYRVVVVQDKQTISGGTLVPYGDIFETLVQTGESIMPVGTGSVLRQGTWGRFDILYDKTHTLTQNDPSIDVNGLTVKVKQERVGYNGPGADSISRNGIYVVVLVSTGNVVDYVETGDIEYGAVDTEHITGTALVRPSPCQVFTRMCYYDQ